MDDQTRVEEKPIELGALLSKGFKMVAQVLGLLVVLVGIILVIGLFLEIGTMLKQPQGLAEAVDGWEEAVRGTAQGGDFDRRADAEIRILPEGAASIYLPPVRVHNDPNTATLELVRAVGPRPGVAQAIVPLNLARPGAILLMLVLLLLMARLALKIITTGAELVFRAKE